MAGFLLGVHNAICTVALLRREETHLKPFTAVAAVLLSLVVAARRARDHGLAVGAPRERRHERENGACHRERLERSRDKSDWSCTDIRESCSVRSHGIVLLRTN